MIGKTTDKTGDKIGGRTSAKTDSKTDRKTDVRNISSAEKSAERSAETTAERSIEMNAKYAAVCPCRRPRRFYQRSCEALRRRSCVSNLSVQGSPRHLRSSRGLRFVPDSFGCPVTTNGAPIAMPGLVGATSRSVRDSCGRLRGLNCKVACLFRFLVAGSMSKRNLSRHRHLPHPSQSLRLVRGSSGFQAITNGAVAPMSG
jgi:hypothetical protein